MAIDERIDAARPYFKYSTEPGFRKKFGQTLSARTDILPPKFHTDELHLTLERGDGVILEVSLPYVDRDHISWQSESGPRYPGFTKTAIRETFDLYLPVDENHVLILDWHNFRGDLVADMDWLMDYAVRHDLLGHDIIWDGRTSSGGRDGPYAIQRLSPRPFKTTFSNLRISDVTPLYVTKETETRQDRFSDWLAIDVPQAYDAGKAYTDNVPFKLEHAPKDSDGIIQPVEVHFRGAMVCLLGPYGGSRLDQFAAIVVDNDLCHTIGMPTAGYSNASEWKEEVVYPGTEQPVIGFMWTIGHTIRPNGEILEGNPAEVAEYNSLSRDNFANYTELLLERALSHLATF